MYTGRPLECHWLNKCALGYHWETQRILAEYTRTPLEKLSWNCPTLEYSDYCSLHWNTTGGTTTAPPHTHTHIIKQSSIWASFKWQDDWTPSSKWTGLYKFSFYMEFTALQCIPMLFKVWVLQHHSVHAFDMSTIIVFVYLGLHYIWNHLSLNNSLVIPVAYIRGCMLGSDLT